MFALLVALLRVGYSLCVIGSSIDKCDQFGNPAGPNGGFPLLQSHLPLAFSEKAIRASVMK